jgi:hypothetical protein
VIYKVSLVVSVISSDQLEPQAERPSRIAPVGDMGESHAVCGQVHSVLRLVTQFRHVIPESPPKTRDGEAALQVCDRRKPEGVKCNDFPSGR